MALGDNEATPSETLTKAQLADMLYERVGLSKREAKEVVEAFFH